jgi:hypothetical protein
MVIFALLTVTADSQTYALFFMYCLIRFSTFLLNWSGLKGLLGFQDGFAGAIWALGPYLAQHKNHKSLERLAHPVRFELAAFAFGECLFG